MFYVLTAWVILTGVLCFSAHITIWARTGAEKPRTLSMLSFFGGSLVAALAIILCVGWSTPCITYLTAPAGKYNVLGYQLIPDDKIHLLLEIPGFSPRACYIPWSIKNAEKLEEGKKGKNGSEVKLPPLLGDGDDGELQIWPKPPTPNGPPKENSDIAVN